MSIQYCTTHGNIDTDYEEHFMTCRYCDIEKCVDQMWDDNICINCNNENK